VMALSEGERAVKRGTRTSKRKVVLGHAAAKRRRH
jgi:hypothetical protein